MSSSGAEPKPLSPYAIAEAELHRLGYHAIPIMPLEKAPGEFKGGRWWRMKDWPRFKDRAPSQFERKLWGVNFPEANIGIVLGSYAGDVGDERLRLVAVDIDTTDLDEFETIIECIPHSPMVKRGTKGETRFYRSPISIRSRPYSHAGDKHRMVDLLTGQDTRQTVVPPSVHVDSSGHPSGNIYVWMYGPVAATELPIFGQDELDRLEDTLRHLGWNPDAQRPEASPAKPRVIGDDDDWWAETKVAALADLEAWVPHLELYGLRRARGGYEAVATWRPSSSGKPIEQRKRNLSIQPNGISDFGDGPRGYSAIDLVMAANRVERSEAVEWLRDRLNFARGPEIVLAPRARPVEVVDAETGEITSGDHAVTTAVTGAAAQLEELPDKLTRVPGLVGELVDWIVDTARYPTRSLALGAALTLVGTAAGRKYAGPTISATHLYVLALAGTASGKDHALKQITRILNAAGMAAHVGPVQFMSWQAIINDVSRQPLLLSPMDEFGAFMQRINARFGSNNEKGMSGVFRTLWSTSFDTLPAVSWAQKSGTPIHSPSLSIYGASVPEEFYKSLSGNDVDNGFLNRFLLISTRRKSPKQTPKLDRFVVPPSISEQMQAIYHSGNSLAAATSHNGQADKPMFIVPWEHADVERAYNDFADACLDLEDGQPLYGRTAEMAIRLATIRAIGRNIFKPAVSLADINWAIALAKWSAERLIAETADYLSDTPFQAEAQRVLRKIKERGRISQRDLARALGVKTKKKDLEDTLATLKDAGLATCEERIPPTGGPLTKWWWAT